MNQLKPLEQQSSGPNPSSSHGGKNANSFEMELGKFTKGIAPSLFQLRHWDNAWGSGRLWLQLQLGKEPFAP